MALSYNRTYVENQSTGKALEGVVVRVYKNNVLQSVFADESSTPLPTVLTGEDGSAIYYVNGDGLYEEEYIYNGDILDRVKVNIFNPANYAPSSNFSAPSGAGLVGSSDGASGTLWTTVAGFITNLRSSVGSAIVGFLPEGIGAIFTTAQMKLRQMAVTLEEFGGGTGIADNTNALKAALKTGRPLRLKASVPFALAVYEFGSPIDFGAINLADGIKIPNVHIFGDGMGKVRLRYIGAGLAMIGGLTAPAAGGYKQTFNFHDFDYYGNGRVDTTGVVPSSAFSYQRFVTTPNVFSGSNSTQTGMFLEMDGGSQIRRCRLAGWQTALRTKKGYNAVIDLNQIDYNQVGLDLTQDVTTLTVRNNDINRNSIGIALWQTQEIIIQGNAIQANFSGCDIYSFAQNRQVKIDNNYYEASLECLVQDGDASIAANNNMGWEITDNKALKVRITEGAYNWNFRRNAIAIPASPVGLASKPSFIIGTTNITNVTADSNVQNDDMRLRFTDYTGTGAANLLRVDGIDQTMFRATGAFAPASGPGMEMIFSGGSGQLTSFDRTGLTYLNMLLNGTAIGLAPNGGVRAWARTTGFFVASGALGYEAGAGGAVTQSTSKATGVTLNTATGAITMNASALAASTSVAFTLTNSQIGANDTVTVSIKSGATSLAYLAGVEAVAAGSANFVVRNVSAGALGEALVLNYTVTKGAVT